MAWQQESLFQLMSPSSFDETQVQLLVWSIDLIANNWVPYGGEMHPNLMSASGARNRANQRKLFLTNPQLSLRDFFSLPRERIEVRAE